MKAKILKDIVNSIDDDTEIFIRNSVNSCGNVSELIQVELATYYIWFLRTKPPMPYFK